MSREVPRDLLVRADSYLSLLWYRPSTPHDTDLQIEIPKVIGELRAAYEQPQAPFLPDPLRALLQQKIQEWRDLAKMESIESADSELVLLRCADELEAVLAALPGEQP